jgi:hypothetical protein
MKFLPFLLPFPSNKCTKLPGVIARFNKIDVSGEQAAYGPRGELSQRSQATSIVTIERDRFFVLLWRHGERRASSVMFMTLRHEKVRFRAVTPTKTSIPNQPLQLLATFSRPSPQIAGVSTVYPHTGSAKKS